MKGLTNYQKFLILRPLPPNTKTDEFGNPVLKKDNYNDIEWDEVKYTSLSNISSVKNNRQKFVPLLFHYDYSLDRIWNDPFKFFSRISGFLLAPTPDFSAYIGMNPKEIEHNIFKSRWIGSWAQYFHYKVLITVTWGSKDTYDLCFGGIPEGIPVLISTVGCLGCRESFLDGFNEMKRRIKPSIIIVRGKVIEGMTGNFIFIDFKDTFNINKNIEQLLLLELPAIYTIKEEI